MSTVIWELNTSDDDDGAAIQDLSSLFSDMIFKTIYLASSVAASVNFILKVNF